MNSASGCASAWLTQPLPLSHPCPAPVSIHPQGFRFPKHSGALPQAGPVPRGRLRAAWHSSSTMERSQHSGGVRPHGEQPPCCELGVYSSGGGGHNPWLFFMLLLAPFEAGNSRKEGCLLNRALPGYKPPALWIELLPLLEHTLTASLPLLQYGHKRPSRGWWHQRRALLS